MEMTQPVAWRPLARALPACGAALVAIAVYAAVAARQPLLAAIAGAGGLALLRMAFAERPYSSALIAIDAAAFALFALDATMGSASGNCRGRGSTSFGSTPRGGHRSDRLCRRLGHGPDRRLSRAAAGRGAEPDRGPFLFNLLLASAPTGTWPSSARFVTAHAGLPFPAQVAIGRALTLWFIGEAILTLINLVSVNQLPRSARTHALFALSGAVAAATPLFANAAQRVAQPFLAIFFSALCAALAQAGLWAIVYLLTGVALDWLGGRPPRFRRRGSIGGPASSRARSTARCSWASSSSPP